MMAEAVYVLTNETMEGLVKIGRTTTSVERRMRELNKTSMPLPFQCFYAGEVAVSALARALGGDAHIWDNTAVYPVLGLDKSH